MKKNLHSGCWRCKHLHCTGGVWSFKIQTDFLIQTVSLIELSLEDDAFCNLKSLSTAAIMRLLGHNQVSECYECIRTHSSWGPHLQGCDEAELSYKSNSSMFVPFTQVHLCISSCFMPGGEELGLQKGIFSTKAAKIPPKKMVEPTTWVYIICSSPLYLSCSSNKALSCYGRNGVIELENSMWYLIWQKLFVKVVDRNIHLCVYKDGGLRIWLWRRWRDRLPSLFCSLSGICRARNCRCWWWQRCYAPTDALKISGQAQRLTQEVLLLFLYMMKLSKTNIFILNCHSSICKKVQHQGRMWHSSFHPLQHRNQKACLGWEWYLSWGRNNRKFCKWSVNTCSITLGFAIWVMVTGQLSWPALASSFSSVKHLQGFSCQASVAVYWNDFSSWQGSILTYGSIVFLQLTTGKQREDYNFASFIISEQEMNAIRVMNEPF